MKLQVVGRSLFALGMIGLGIWSIVYQNFLIGRPPGWIQPQALPILAILSSGVLIILCIAILMNWKGAWSAFTLAGVILVFSLLRYPMNYNNDWLNGLKALSLFGSALIIGLSFERGTPGSPSFLRNDKTYDRILYAGMLLTSLFFIGAGYAHFKFADFVEAFIPAFIPFRRFFALFCGVCLVVGGVGLFVKPVRTWAALLSGIMVGGWFVLLHIPRIVMNPDDDSDRLGLCESFAFSGMYLVLYTVLKEKA